jgi:hypothetical protein
LRDGSRGGGERGDGGSGFFSYGFRHPIMLIENFFEHVRFRPQGTS